MKIQNKALANTGLSIGGKVIEGDDDGIFDMSEDSAEQMLATPGWHPPIVEPKPDLRTPRDTPEPEEEPAGDAAEETPAETPEEEPSEPTEAPAGESKPTKKKRKPK